MLIHGKLPVIFREYRGELTAYFPSEGFAAGQITCYAHVGQHGGADPSHMSTGRPATEAEYAPLLAELKGIYEESNADGDPAIPLYVVKRDHKAFQDARRTEWRK